MTASPWLDDYEQRAWRAWLDMHARLSARLHRELQEDAGLSLTDFDVLVQLTDREDGRARVLELAHGLQWEKSRLSHHLGRMQRRGLVAREDCPDDARGSVVALTGAGREAIERAAPQHAQTVRELVFDHLAGSQVAALEAISRQVLRRLDDAP